MDMSARDPRFCDSDRLVVRHSSRLVLSDLDSASMIQVGNHHSSARFRAGEGEDMRAFTKQLIFIISMTLLFAAATAQAESVQYVLETPGVT